MLNPPSTPGFITLAVAFGSLGLAVGPGCIAPPLDTLGVETLVTEHKGLSKQEKIEDDLIEDKHPVFDPAVTVDEVFDECVFTLNKSGSVTKLDIMPFEGESKKALDGALFSDRGAALDALRGLDDADPIPSMETINGAAKHLNDALYAAVEAGLQRGHEGELVGKHEVLEGLVDGLLAAREAATCGQQIHVDAALVHLGAALILAGADGEQLPAALAVEAEDAAARFVADPLHARPMGFYAESDELARIFRQDRFLQNHSDPSGGLGDQFGAFVAIAAVLQADPALTEVYSMVDSHAVTAGVRF